MDGNPRETPEFHRNLLCGKRWFNPNGRGDTAEQMENSSSNICVIIAREVWALHNS